jgi:hypothetical protein
MLRPSHHPSLIILTSLTTACQLNSGIGRLPFPVTALRNAHTTPAVRTLCNAENMSGGRNDSNLLRQGSTFARLKLRFKSTFCAEFKFRKRCPQEVKFII